MSERDNPVTYCPSVEAVLFECNPPSFIGYHAAKMVAYHLIQKQAQFKWYIASEEGARPVGFTIKLDIIQPEISGENLKKLVSGPYGRPNLQKNYDYINCSTRTSYFYRRRDAEALLKQALIEVIGIDGFVDVGSAGIFIRYPLKSFDELGAPIVAYLLDNIVPFVLDGKSTDEFYKVRVTPWWSDFEGAMTHVLFLQKAFERK